MPTDIEKRNQKQEIKKLFAYAEKIKRTVSDEKKERRVQS